MPAVGWTVFLLYDLLQGWRHKTGERYRSLTIPLFGVRVGKSFDSYTFPLLLRTGIERLDLPVVFFGPFFTPLLGVSFRPSLECLPVLGIQGNGLGELVNRFLQFAFAQQGRSAGGHNLSGGSRAWLWQPPRPRLGLWFGFRFTRLVGLTGRFRRRRCAGLGRGFRCPPGVCPLGV